MHYGSYDRKIHHRWFAAVVVLLAVHGVAAKQPELKSVFPLVIPRGSDVSVTVHGEHLGTVRGVWFDCASIEGKVVHADASDVTLSVHALPGSAPGFHALQVISPQGMSSPVALVITPDPIIGTTGGPIRSVPSIVNGRLNKPESMDRYIIEGRPDQPLRLEVITGSGLYETNTGVFTTPLLRIFRTEGSWLDPDQHPELLCGSESRSFEFPRLSYIEHQLQRLVCRFPDDARYLVSINSRSGSGGSDLVYALRITSASTDENWIERVPAHSDPHDYNQLTFRRRLDSHRLEMLQRRAATAAKPPAVVPVIAENEPNDRLDQAQSVQLPVLIEGRVGRAGDVDLYRLEAEAGEAVAFELETPELPAPLFSPRLGVLDSSGQELVANIYRKIDGDGDDWIKSLEPKTLYTFAAAGAYFVRVRDLTSRSGGNRCLYRLLIRRQVPHLGRVTVRQSGTGFQTLLKDHLNVTRGGGIRVAIISEQEEGMACDLAIELRNLPPGVHVSMAPFGQQKGIYVADDEAYEGRWEALQNVHRERYRPRRRVAFLMLTADAGAPEIVSPRLVQVVTTPLVNGRQARSIVTQELPLIVADDTPETGSPGSTAREK